MDHYKYQVVDVKDLKPSPIRHEDLPDWFLIRAQLVHHIIGAGSPLNFQSFIENFQRDADPEQELIIWERIAAAFVVLTVGPEKINNEAGEIISILLFVSTIPSDHLNSVDGDLQPFAEAYLMAAQQGKSAIKKAEQ